MIQLFSRIINTLAQKETEQSQQYKAAYEENILPAFLRELSTAACPPKEVRKKCGAVGGMSYHAKYKRAVIRDVINDEIKEYTDIEIGRVICFRCKTTHALLLWFIPPYSRHTLRFIFTVLLTYYQKTLTVEALCAKYDITHPTLYAWVKKYQEQCEDLRKLFDPPLLPDVTAEFEHWDNGAEVVMQIQSEQNAPAAPGIGICTDEDELTSTSEVPVACEPEVSKIRAEKALVFEKAVFIAIKTTIEQDNPSIFEEYYAVHRTAFFQRRRIRSGVSRGRVRPRSP